MDKVKEIEAHVDGFLKKYPSLFAYGKSSM